MVDYYYPVHAPGRIVVKEAGVAITLQIVPKPSSSCFSETPRLVYMDYEAIEPPLGIRNMQPGDRIQPVGMVGKKKIKSLFIDEKVPRARRSLFPLFVDRRSVLWVAGLRMSARAAVTDRTRQVLKVEII